MFRADEAFRRTFLSFVRHFKESRNNSALRALREMKHQTNLTPQLYCAWIDTLALAGEISELSGVLDEMRARAVPITQDHYKHLTSAWSAAHRFHACEELARDMNMHGIKPDSEFLNFLTQHEQSTKLKPMLAILQGKDSSAQRATTHKTHANPLPYPFAPPPPNAVAQHTKPADGAAPSQDSAQNADEHTFHQHLKVEIKGANEEQCAALLRKLRGITSSATTYNVLMSAAPNERIAWMLLNDMVAQRVKPTLTTFNTLLRIPSAKGIQGSVEVLIAMKKFDIQPDAVTYNQLMKLRLDEKDKPGFISFFNMMQKKDIKPTISTYNQMLHFARILRDRLMYVEATQLLEKDKSVEPNAATIHLLESPDDPKFWLN